MYYWRPKQQIILILLCVFPPRQNIRQVKNSNNTRVRAKRCASPGSRGENVLESVRLSHSIFWPGPSVPTSNNYNHVIYYPSEILGLHCLLARLLRPCRVPGNFVSRIHEYLVSTIPCFFQPCNSVQ